MEKRWRSSWIRKVTCQAQGSKTRQTSEGYYTRIFEKKAISIKFSAAEKSEFIYVSHLLSFRLPLKGKIFFSKLDKLVENLYTEVIFFRSQATTQWGLGNMSAQKK